MIDHVLDGLRVLGHIVKENWGLFAALAGSITLMQVQAIVGICSALVVMGYTLWKWRRESKQ